MACVSGIQKHRPGADRTKFQVGLEKKEGRFRAYAGSPDSPSFIDDNVLPVNMPAFTPAQKQSGRTGGRSQSGMGETLKNRSVNHHLVHPDISPGQVILHPGSIFPPPPFHFSSGTGNHIDDHGAGNESMLQQNGQAGACGTMQSPDCNRSIFTIDQIIDTPIQGMHQPRKGSQIGSNIPTWQSDYPPEGSQPPGKTVHRPHASWQPQFPGRQTPWRPSILYCRSFPK